MYSKLVYQVKPMTLSHMMNRNRNIDSIVIHYTATTVLDGANVVNYWYDTNKYTSANYIIDVYGRITGVVPEQLRPYTTGSFGLGARDIDDHAITVECSCDDNLYLTVSNKTIEALTDLMADIGLRYKIKWRFTGNENGNIHAHRWYQATPCPGDYLYSKMPEIEVMANHKMKGGVDKMEERSSKLEERVSKLEGEIYATQDVCDDLDELTSRHIKPVFNKLDDIPVWARPEIKWLMDKGYLKGDPSGLQLSMDLLRCLVIMVRAVNSEVKL